MGDVDSHSGRITIMTRAVEKWEEFTAFLEPMNIHKDAMVWCFRGQADEAWRLEPTLLRSLGSHVTRGTPHGIERGALMLFRSQYHLHWRPGMLNPVEQGLSDVFWWTLMQQYSCPTRLLDWTYSPYVAAYFAAEQLPDVDGAIWFFNSAHLDTFTSRRYGEMKNLDNNCFYCDDPHPAVYQFFPVLHTERSVAQQGAYTVSTDILAEHSTLIARTFEDSAGHTFLSRVVIPARLKSEFLSRLRSMNITASSLFPGMDGVGRAVREHVRLRVWSEKPG